MFTNSSTIAAVTPAAPPLEFLSFRLGAEEYGIDIQKVQELRGYDNVTRMANAPAYLKGVINLRGIIVPIVDMRMRLGLAAPDYNQFTVVIIADIAGTVTGLVVDGVSDVLTLSAAQIKPAPPVGSAAGAAHLLGVGTLDQRLLLLVDADRWLAGAAVDAREPLAA